MRIKNNCSRPEQIKVTCKLTVDKLCLGVYTLDPNLMVDCGKSSTETLTVYISFGVSLAGNDRVQVFCWLKQRRIFV